jgi:hypothetical protein
MMLAVALLVVSRLLAGENKIVSIGVDTLLLFIFFAWQKRRINTLRYCLKEVNENQDSKQINTSPPAYETAHSAGMDLRAFTPAR